MLARKSYAACSHERVVYDITFFTVTLVCHKQGQFVVGTCRSKVGSLLQVVRAKESIVVIVVTRFLTQPLSSNYFSAVNSSVSSILYDFVNYLRIVQTNVVVNERKLFEHFDDVQLFSHRNLPSYSIYYELKAQTFV